MEFEPDLTEEDIPKMIRQGEGHLCDFKQQHVSKEMPAEHRERKQSEFVKDVLAFANTRRGKSAYIIVGVSDDRRVVGITSSRDDAEFQTIFRDRVNRTLVFRYYEILTADSVRLGIFEISVQQPRPIYLRQPYGGVFPYVVYVRKGSTNGILEPERWREIDPAPATSGQMSADPSTDVSKLVTRWLNLFEVNDVKHHQIPTLFPDHFIPLSALANREQVAGLLTEKLLIDTCHLFNVRREWLAGDSERIYQGISLIHDVRGFLDVLEEWVPQCRRVTLLGLRDGKRPLETEREQNCVFMLRGTIAEFGEKEIFKFQPVYSIFRWDYEKGRTIARIAWLAARIAGCDFCGFRLSRSDLEAIDSDTQHPLQLIGGPWRHEWHPEDFTYPSDESAASKDADEYPTIRDIATRLNVIARAEQIGKD